MTKQKRGIKRVEETYWKRQQGNQFSFGLSTVVCKRKAILWHIPPKINIQILWSKLLQTLLPQKNHSAILITCLLWVQHQSDTMKMPPGLPNNYAHLKSQHKQTCAHIAGWNTALHQLSRWKSDNNDSFSWIIERGVLTSSYLSLHLQLSLSLSVSYPFSPQHCSHSCTCVHWGEPEKDPLHAQ